jgi:hypothetical protein
VKALPQNSVVVLSIRTRSCSLLLVSNLQTADLTLIFFYKEEVWSVRPHVSDLKIFYRFQSNLVSVLCAKTFRPNLILYCVVQIYTF